MSLRAWGMLAVSLTVLFAELLLFLGCQSVSGSEVPLKNGEPISLSPAKNKEETMKLESSSFTSGAAIPVRYTCQGSDISAPLSWRDAPSETRSFALIIDDPDAPDPKHPKMVWVHWVLYNIPADIRSLAEGCTTLPGTTQEGINDWKKTGYRGPCPPIGEHRYFHKLYALDTILPDLKHPTKDKLLQAMRGHILAEAELMGTYQKQ